MNFTSWPYAVFLAAVFALYYCWRNAVYRKFLLLVASIFFYGFIHPKLALLLISCALVGYSGALLIERRQSHVKMIFAVTVALLLLNLSFFKYSDFIADNILQLAGIGDYLVTTAHALEGAIRSVYAWLGLTSGSSRLLPPLGISFYTFQCIGYVVDVYRRQMRAERNPLNIVLFVAFFPQLVAGPIERAEHLLPQFDSQRSLCLERLASSFPLLLTGLVKKMVVADNLALIVDKVYAQSYPSPQLLYIATFAFAFQIYCDFSGYTDIARASARLLGIDLLENFNSPYLARTPVEFWQRWHISFSRWIRDYLYIPLGGSRQGGMAGFFLIILLTMSLSGLWHGAAWHFILWGALHGLLVFITHLVGWHKKKVFSFSLSGVLCIINFNIMLVTWVLFRAPSLSWIYNLTITSAESWGKESLLTLRPVVFDLLLYLLPLLIIALYYKLNNHWLRGGVLWGLACILLLLARTTEYDFIYFRF